MRRNVLTSPRLLQLKKRRRRAVWSKIIFLLLGLAIFFTASTYLSRLNSLNISDVEITGNKVLDTEMLKGAAQGAISGKYLWLFPKTNVFFYPKSAIEGTLFDNFKRIKSINLSIKNSKILAVSLTEREGKYTWCGAVVSSGTEEKCYFMDEDGYIFDEAPYFSGEVYFKFYGLIADNPLGVYFSKQNFKQLVYFKDFLLDFGLKPIALYAGNTGGVEVYLSGSKTSTTEPKIILSANSDFENVAENLQAALTTEPLQSEFKNKYSSLQYIDLRFGNKVYYKF